MFNTILVQPLLNILFAIYAIIPGHDFGVAVILLTLLVRLALWPLVTKQLHSQKAMQAMQPEIAKIRAQTKGDRQKETEMLMELYKEKGTNPFASLLPLIIQLPIFFALYAVLRDSIHTDQIAKLLYQPVKQLSEVSHILAHQASFSPTLFGVINLTKSSWILALLAGAAQFYQTRQLTARQNLDDQAKAMAAASNFFPILTIGIGLTLPSALALYWVVNSLVAIIQQHLILVRDAQEMEEIK